MNPTLKGMTSGCIIFLLIIVIILWATVILTVMLGGFNVLHFGIKLTKSKLIAERLIAIIISFVGICMMLVGIGLIVLSIWMLLML